MKGLKKILLFVLSILGVIGTYIGINQFTDRNGSSINTSPKQQEQDYGLGLPKSASSSGGTRNTHKNEL